MKGYFYRKNRIILLIIACLPTLVIGLGLYYFLGSHFEKEFSRLHQTFSENAAGHIQESFSRLEDFVTQISLSPALGSHLAHADLAEKYNDTNNVYRSLLVLKNSNPLIDKVYLYLDNQSVLISDTDGITPISDPDKKQKYHSLLHADDLAYWVTNQPEALPIGNSSPVVFVQGLSGEQPLYGALVIFINQSELKKVVVGKLSSSYPEGISLLIDEKGNPINGKMGSREDSPLETAVKSDIANMGQSGIFSFDGDKSMFSLSVNPLPRRGNAVWQVVTAVPVTQVMKPVTLMLRLILGNLGLGLLVAVLLSWFASQQIYKPIQRILNLFREGKRSAPLQEAKNEIDYIEGQWNNVTRESRSIQEKWENALPFMRERFVLQLMQGNLDNLSEEHLQKRMSGLGWEMAEKRFAIMVIQLISISQTECRFSEGDEPLVIFATANILSEVLKKRMDGEIVNTQDLVVGVLLTIPSGWAEEQVKDEMFRMAEEMIHTINAYLKTSLNICLSKGTDSIGSIPGIFEQAQQALRLRDIHEINRVFVLDDFLPSDDQSAFYPFLLEKEIMQAVRMGTWEEIIRLLDVFYEEICTRKHTELSAQFCFFQLIGAIQSVILQNGINPTILYGGSNMFHRLSEMRDPADMMKWIKTKLIHPYVMERNSLHDSRLKEIAGKVMESLHENYRTDISLEHYAGMYGISSYTLSKVFKQAIGVNFIDYLTNLRLEQAKRRLRETDIRIYDVAEEVGYQHTYFNKLFKRIEGLTPSEYRDMNKRAFPQ